MGNLGAVVGGIALAFVSGYIFLGLLWLIPPLRRRTRAWYMTAAALAWLLGFVSISGYTLGHAIGAAIFTALAFYRSRPKRQQAAPAATPAPRPID